MSRETTFDVIVIGGGASGMMAAGRAAELGKKVLLIEKNRKLGEKLRITGGGRCNITNAEFDTRTLLGFYGKGEQFLYSSFAQFGVQDTFNFFEKRGLPLVIQARKRAFPNTENAEDVCKVMEKYIATGKVTVAAGASVSRIETEEGKISKIICGTKEYTGTNIILATGGVSHPETGSTGDGFEFLKKLGHTVSDPTPTIVPVSVSNEWIKELAGKSLPDIKITFFVDGKKLFMKTGTVLCTHFGLSGPTILNSAHKIGDALHEGIVTATIDLFPKMDLGTLERHLISIFDENKNKILKNIFKEFTPPGTATSILTLVVATIDPETKVHSVTKEQRKELVRTLKALPVTITGLMGYDRAVVADGGVTLSEIDTKTMRSLKIPNLFVTGDLLHINRPSGGYSLQLCWTTGFVAGSNA